MNLLITSLLVLCFLWWFILFLSQKILLILCHPRLLFWYLVFRYRWAHHLCFLSMNDLSRSSFFDWYRHTRNGQFPGNLGNGQKKKFITTFFLFFYGKYFWSEGVEKLVHVHASMYPGRPAPTFFQVWLLWLCTFRWAMLQKQLVGENFWRCLFWQAFLG